MKVKSHHKAILVVGVLLVTGSLYAGLSSHLREPAAATPKPEVHVVDQPLVTRVNIVRQQAGKPPLTEDPLLDQDAALKVTDQVKRNYWAHHLPGEDTRQFVTQYPNHVVAENIAKCQTTDQQRIGDWKASPEHYATMIGDYDGFGHAEMVNPKDSNCVYSVTYFIRY